MVRNKFKNTRLVTFNEDLKSKKGTVLIKKGKTVAMHVITANKVKERGAKITIKELDSEKLIRQRKTEMEDAD